MLTFTAVAPVIFPIVIIFALASVPTFITDAPELIFVGPVVTVKPVPAVIVVPAFTNVVVVNDCEALLIEFVVAIYTTVIFPCSLIAIQFVLATLQTNVTQSPIALEDNDPPTPAVVV